MTCIVAVKDRDRGGVVMGCDGLSTKGEIVRLAAYPKVVRRGDFLIGASGFATLAYHALFRFVPPKQRGNDLLSYMMGDFTMSLINGLKRLEHLSFDAENPAYLFLLVAVKDRIFEV